MLGVNIAKVIRYKIWKCVYVDVASKKQEPKGKVVLVQNIYSCYSSIKDEMSGVRLTKQLHHKNVSMQNNLIVICPDKLRSVLKDESENTFVERSWIPHKLLFLFLGQRKSYESR